MTHVLAFINGPMDGELWKDSVIDSPLLDVPGSQFDHRYIRKTVHWHQGAVLLIDYEYIGASLRKPAQDNWPEVDEIH